jgi:hypothetical protein
MVQRGKGAAAGLAYLEVSLVCARKRPQCEVSLCPAPWHGQSEFYCNNAKLI